MYRSNSSLMVAAAALIATLMVSSTEAYMCDGLLGGTLIKWFDPTQCNRFYACQHGVDHEWFCPPGEFFSQRNQQCEATCNPLDTNQWCAGLADGVFIRVPMNEPFDCNKYYTCVGGVMHAQRCPPGFLFSQLKQACGNNVEHC